MLGAGQGEGGRQRIDPARVFMHETIARIQNSRRGEGGGHVLVPPEVVYPLFLPHCSSPLLHTL